MENETVPNLTQVIWKSLTTAHTHMHLNTQRNTVSGPAGPRGGRYSAGLQWSVSSHVGWAIVWLVASWLAGVTGITVPIDSGAGFVLAVLSAEKQYYAGWESSEPTLARDPVRGGWNRRKKEKLGLQDMVMLEGKYKAKRKKIDMDVFLINRT